LSAAGYGSEIWVQAGVHYPGAAGNYTATFTLKNGVRLYGGFAGTETSRDERNWRANPTILSGDIDRNDITLNGVVTDASNIVGENAYHVLRGENLGADTVLDGFIITAGQANDTGYPHPYGGGMYLYNSSPTLAHLTFSGNLASLEGGGLCTNDGHPVLNDVTFHGNQAWAGGGMNKGFDGAATLVNVVFSHNRANNGGGMVNNGSATLRNVVFSANSANTHGGGMTNYGAPTLVNVTFNANSANSADSAGGGLYNSWATPALTNTILWGNSAPTGPEIANDNSTTSISYSDIQGCGGSGSGWNSACGTDGGGNIDADPRFRDAAGGNLRLQFTSPAIDAGNNAAVPPGVATDLDGNPRFVDIPSVPDTGNGAPPIVDMGAYEAQGVDIVLGKAVAPPTAVPGQAVTFTLALSNTGSITATGIVVTDALPAILTDLSFTSTLAVADTSHIPPYVWMVQDLAVGQGGVITVSGVLTVPLAAGVYTNTAVITATGDLLAGNTTAVVTFTVVNVAPVFTSAPVVTATQDVPYIYTAVAADDNGDALTIIAPNNLHYVVIEDPIPAGTDAVDPNLRTTSVVGTQPEELNLSNPLSRGWGWWYFSNTEFRDEKVVIYATYLPRGTYEYSYIIRTGLPGAYNVIPTTGQEFYFPEVYGRSDGMLFTITPEE
jgi:uncharacterized repeat protein (TIGR01451 family)